ncbi:TetR/AcrR family transcriptional regulator [Deinococcus sp. VB343]|uniref:TetR/AcrR family transcriptional regulator n=1 Tax=Deinococcus sp. VB142 TaxID=3112952 RepID=A0AAU6Q7J5_9DEIO
MTVALPRPNERRTQAERSESMRQKLLEATLDCLVTDGYVGLTIGKVTERAGVSRGAPLHHFSSKSGLMEAAAREVVRRVSAKLVLAYEHSKDAPDPLEAFGLELWKTVFSAQEGILLGELTYASRREPEIHAIVQRLWTRIYITARRSAARYLGDVHPDLPPERVMFLSQWLMRGMAQDLHLGAPPELFEAYLKMWRRSLGGRSDVSAKGSGNLISVGY